MIKSIDNIIRRLSIHQLKALNLLSKSSSLSLTSSNSFKKIGKSGKALGGIFSSLSRRDFGDQKLLLPWGRSEGGRGLNWKLNEKLISREKLREITDEILST